MSFAAHIPAVLCLVFACVLVAAEFKSNSTARAASKVLAAACFLVYGFTGGAWAAGLSGQLIVAGLAFSVVGDLCLLSRAEATFKLGIFAFLVAHLWYMAAFFTLGVSVTATAVGAVVLGLAALGVWRWLGPHVGSLRVAVIAYVCVITGMVTYAVGAAGADPSLARVGLLAAAILFFASDLCVARDRFIVQELRNPVIGIPLYFTAQVLFALFGGMI